MIFSTVNKILNNFERIVVGLGLLFTTAIIFVNVVARSFGNSFVWAEELSRYVLIWITFVGASMCVRNGSHVTMDVVFNRFPPKLKKKLFLLINIFGVVMSLLLTNYGMQIVLKIYSRGQISPTIGLPMYWVYLGVPVGAILMAKNFLHIFIINLRSKNDEIQDTL